MTNEEIIEKIRTTLAEEFEVDIDVIQPDAPLMETLELDSLDLVDMVVLVEKNFGFNVTGQDFAEGMSPHLPRLLLYFLHSHKLPLLHQLYQKASVQILLYKCLLPLLLPALPLLIQFLSSNLLFQLILQLYMMSLYFRPPLILYWLLHHRS